LQISVCNPFSFFIYRLQGYGNTVAPHLLAYLIYRVRKNPICVFRSSAHSAGGIGVSKDEGTLAEIARSTGFGVPAVRPAHHNIFCELFSITKKRCANTIRNSVQLTSMTN
jgi:hypothetical protein